jgi:hypothetical protein
MRLLLPLLFPVVLMSQIGGSNTQYQVIYWCSTPNTSTLIFSASPTLATPVDDTNTALFSGSTSANRAGNVIIGNKVIFNVGSRTSSLALDGFNHSHALFANTPYYYRINCNGSNDAIRGPVTTGNIALGNTWLDPIAAPSGFGGSAWSFEGTSAYPDFTRWDTSDTTARLESHPDPQTGASIQRLTMPDDLGKTGDDVNFNLASGANWTASDAGTLIHAVSIDDTVYATNSTSSDWLILTANYTMLGKNGGTDQNPHGTLERLISSVKGWCSSTANCAEMALSVNGGASIWPSPSNIYSLNLGTSPLPGSFVTYGGGSQSMYPWTPAQSQPLMSADVSYRNGNVTVDAGGVVSWVVDGSTRSRFYQGWIAGTPISIGASLCTVSAYTSPERLTVVPASCSPSLTVPIASPTPYSGGGLSLMIRRKIGSANTLNIQYAKIHEDYGNGSVIIWSSGGNVKMCNDNLKLNSVNGHLGSLCVISGYAWWVDGTNGQGNLITQLNVPSQGGTDGWSSVSCPGNQGFLGTSPTSLESFYCTAIDNSSKTVILSCILYNAAGNAVPTYQAGDGSVSCQNITKSSTGKDINTLIANFTSGQVSLYDKTLFGVSLNPSIPWSDSKVWLRANRGPQDTPGWVATFDPNLVGSTPGCVGGGAPGCVAAAKDSWSASPNRWDSIHAVDALGNVVQFTGHAMGSSIGDPGGNFYSVTLQSANLPPTPSIAAGAVNGGTTCTVGSLGCDVVNVDGEPCIITPAPAGAYPAEPLNCPKNGAQSWLQNAAVGDILATNDCITTTQGGIGCNDSGGGHAGHSGEVEFLKILDKRGSPWSSSLVQRGYGTGGASKLSVAGGNANTFTAGNSVTATSYTFSPGMVGGTININSVNYTVSTYVDSTHITLTTSPGNQSSVPWVWPHQPSTNIVTNMMPTGRTFSNSSMYPGALVVWDYNHDVHGLNGAGTTVKTILLDAYDHGAINWNSSTGSLSRVGGSDSADPNAPAGSGYSLFEGQSLPVGSYTPTGYGALGPTFNGVNGFSQITGIEQEHPSVGALGSGTFFDVRPVSGPGGMTMVNVTGNLWKMTGGTSDGDNFPFIGWSDNSVCSTNGTAVTWVSGTQFTNNLTANQSGAFYYFWVNGQPHGITNINSLTSLTLRETAGVQNNVPCNGGTASGFGIGSSEALNRKLQPVSGWCGTQPLVDISSAAIGDVIGGTSGNQFQWGIARKAGEMRAASNQGDIYINCPFIAPRTQGYSGTFGCTQFGPEGGTNGDFCVGQPATYTNANEQISTVFDITGFSGRNITHSLFRSKIEDVNANSHVTADGNWLLTEWFAGPGSEFEILAVSVPPTPPLDAYTRSTYIGTPITLPLASNNTFPGGTVSARIKFGYAEFGPAANYYCGTRQETCYANSDVLIPNVPYLYGTSDGPVAGLPCVSGCQIMVPGIPEHLMFAAVEWLNGGGSVLRTDTVSPMIIAPMAFTPAAACSIFPPSLAGGTVGVSYSQSPVANNCGALTLTWTITAGSLPGGLSGCSSVTGVSCTISGTPTTAGTYPVTIQVTDGASNTASNAYSIVIGSSTPSTATAPVSSSTMLQSGSILGK